MRGRHPIQLNQWGVHRKFWSNAKNAMKNLHMSEVIYLFYTQPHGVVEFVHIK